MHFQKGFKQTPYFYFLIQDYSLFWFLVQLISLSTTWNKPFPFRKLFFWLAALYIEKVWAAHGGGMLFLHSHEPEMTVLKIPSLINSTKANSW